MVVVDRLSKYSHFIALSHPYSAMQVPKVYLEQVHILHGLRKRITSDRDPIFVSNFWREFFKLQGVELNLSTAYHPQTDGQTEVVNKCLETYLRCMTGDNPKRWSQYLALAEWWYNTNFHTSAKATPFQLLYGYPPPIHLPYIPGDSRNAEVNNLLSNREDTIRML